MLDKNIEPDAKIRHEVKREMHSALTPEVLLPRMAQMDVPHLFTRWGFVPAVVDICDEVGVWGELGSSRHLLMDNGGSMDEWVIRTDAAHFTTRFADFKKTFGSATRNTEDGWHIEPEASGSRVVWTWTFYQRSHSLRSVIDRFTWGMYMNRVMRGYIAELEAELR